MIMDERLEMADALALNTGGAGTYLLGDQVDLQSEPRDIGEGDQMFLVIQVDTTCTSGGSATATFVLASDASASIATDGSATEHLRTPAYPVASLVAGFTRKFALPAGLLYERYLGLLQITGTAAFTAGKINAFITRDPACLRAYPDGVN